MHIKEEFPDGQDSTCKGPEVGMLGLSESVRRPVAGEEPMSHARDFGCLP